MPTWLLFLFLMRLVANPPILGFSPARRGRDGTVKDTYNNIRQTGEFVVATVSQDLVYRMNVAAGEYDSTIDEFTKSSLTKQNSTSISPFLVKESAFQMECKLFALIPLGNQQWIWKFNTR